MTPANDNRPPSAPCLRRRAAVSAVMGTHRAARLRLAPDAILSPLDDAWLASLPRERSHRARMDAIHDGWAESMLALNGLMFGEVRS